jgi:hypothetical protein
VCPTIYEQLCGQHHLDQRRQWEIWKAPIQISVAARGTPKDRLRVRLWVRLFIVHY